MSCSRRLRQGTPVRVAAALLWLGLAGAHAADAPFTVDESGRGFAHLQAAVDAVGDGRGTVRIAPGHYRECAVQTRGRLAFVAQVAGESVLEGVTCEGKAGLVLRGRGARIEGLVFAGYHVPEGNGAGIRLEHGDLVVSRAWFRDSDEGMLTGNDPAAHIAIDTSRFSHLGRCDRTRACAHSIYAGEYASLTVTRSRFETGLGGHYLKSRAPRIAVTGCLFDDRHGHATNYMIDLPDGATGRISGNRFVQGHDKDNPRVFIAVGAESHDHTADGLVVEGNVGRFAPGVNRESAFVADWRGYRLAVVGNALARGLVAVRRRW